MDPGCPERLNWAFLLWVLSFRKRMRPRILRALSELSSTKQVVQLTSRRGVARWLGQIERERAA
jgi:hypothetical protein